MHLPAAFLWNLTESACSLIPQLGLFEGHPRCQSVCPVNAQFLISAPSLQSLTRHSSHHHHLLLRAYILPLLLDPACAWA